MTVRGQPLGAQRSVQTETQSPTRVRRVFQRRGFLRRQTAMENRALSQAAAAPIPPRVEAGQGRAWGGALGAGPEPRGPRS